MPIHPQNLKFMSNHYALPTFYESEEKATFVPLHPRGYWALKHHVARGSPRPPKPTTSTPPGLHETYIQVIELSHAVTPFGWAVSPRIWVTVFRVVVTALRRAGLRVLAFVNDLLIALISYAESMRAKTIIEETFATSCLTLAPGTGQFEPTQVVVDHLGFRISSKDSNFVTVPERQCCHLRGMARTLLCQSARGKRRVSSAELRKFSGAVVNCMEAVPQARLRLRSIFVTRKRSGSPHQT